MTVDLIPTTVATHTDAASSAARVVGVGEQTSNRPLRYRYRPLYGSPAFAPFPSTAPCAHAEVIGATLVSIPSHEGVGPPELDQIRAAWRG